MTDRQRALARVLYALHRELATHQGEEIAALRAATASLQRSHEVIGKLLHLTAELAGFTDDAP